MQPHRLLFCLLQDRHLKDSNKLINGSKEFKGKMLKVFLMGIEDFKRREELHLLTLLFSSSHYEGAKFSALALSQLNHLVKEVRE